RLRGSVLNTLGEIYFRRGNLQKALALQQESLTISLHCVGPNNIAGAMMGIAETLTVMGRRSEAWQMRVHSFRRYSTSDTGILYFVLDTASRSEGLHGHTDNALALLHVA